LDLFAGCDLSGYTVKGFVSMIFRKWTPTPFEEANQVCTNFKILLGGAISVGAES